MSSQITKICPKCGKKIFIFAWSPKTGEVICADCALDFMDEELEK